jgi:phage gpG-like protein
MEIKIINVDKLQKAIRRNPVAVRNGANRMIRDSTNHLWQIINNTPPWRVGESGGGIPKDTGNLRKVHSKKIEPFLGRIWVDRNKTNAGVNKKRKTSSIYNYADLVHEGTSKMPARPWLRFAEQTGERLISQYRQRFLREVVDNLTK